MASDLDKITKRKAQTEVAHQRGSGQMAESGKGADLSGQKKECPCKRNCKRHGDCAACLAYHRDGKKQVKTACARLAAKKLKKKT